ncbi:hypothetical protein ABZ667_18495 [Streptomyces lavendulae]|uniref:hypothetical protein n=1 Tax=Streptomyces lavendulae TaxID=1914 RepID=UPI0033DE6A36
MRAETAAWTGGDRRPGPARHDGVPASAFGPRSSGGPAAVSDFASTGHVQMVLRLGPVGSATPRRPVTEVLEVR